MQTALARAKGKRVDDQARFKAGLDDKKAPDLFQHDPSKIP